MLQTPQGGHGDHSIYLAYNSLFIQQTLQHRSDSRKLANWTIHLTLFCLFTQTRLVQVAVRNKIRVNDNMSIRLQRIPRLGKGTNDDWFPLAGLLNINELGHMLRPRLRNNRAITSSRGNRDFIFCLVNMSYSPAGPQGIY